MLEAVRHGEINGRAANRFAYCTHASYRKVRVGHAVAQIPALDLGDFRVFKALVIPLSRFHVWYELQEPVGIFSWERRTLRCGRNGRCSSGEMQ